METYQDDEDNTVSKYKNEYERLHGKPTINTNRNSFDNAELNSFVDRKKQERLKRADKVEKEKKKADNIVTKELDKTKTEKAKTDAENFQKEIMPPRSTPDVSELQTLAANSQNALGSSDISNILPTLPSTSKKIDSSKVQTFREKYKANKKKAAAVAGNELASKLNIQNVNDKPVVAQPAIPKTTEPVTSTNAVKPISAPIKPTTLNIKAAELKSPTPLSQNPTPVIPKPFSGVKTKKDQALDLINQLKDINPTLPPPPAPKPAPNLVPFIPKPGSDVKKAGSFPALTLPAQPIKPIEQLNKDVKNIMPIGANRPAPVSNENPLDRLKKNLKNKPVELGDNDIIQSSTEFSTNLTLLENELHSLLELY